MKNRYEQNLCLDVHNILDKMWKEEVPTIKTAEEDIWDLEILAQELYETLIMIKTLKRNKALK